MHQQFERALEVLREQLYIKDHGDNSLEPVACRMHNTFGTAGSQHHNCLGCNFADASNGIDNAISRIVTQPTSIEHDFSYFILSLYLFVERASIIFDIIQLPEPTRHRHFDVFITIRRWANFFKHPNWFVLVHHPDYFVTGDPSFNPSQYSAVVDTTFVRENFNADAKSRSGVVKQKLQNKADIAVLFPDPKVLVEDFATAACFFFELTEKNEVYREILADVSTYENYFSDTP